MKTQDNKRKSGMVRVLGGFSEKSGIQLHNPVLQVKDFDDRSRVQLSNELYRLLNWTLEDIPDRFFVPTEVYNISDKFCRAILNDVFCERINLKAGYHFSWRGVFEDMHKVLMQATYNEVLDVIQYSCNWFDNRAVIYKGHFYKCLNRVFEHENIGYRFVNGRIVPITDEVEIQTIEATCKNPYDGCRKQIQKAVGFLSDREHPDYKNCIKESISAVESICQVIVGNDSATLGAAIKKLEDNGVQIHAALKQGFLKLYGYTSDQGGIRHAEGMFESNVTFEEAKYMLVSCCAFINYLIGEYAKKGN